jgi:hypothetical protein
MNDKVLTMALMLTFIMIGVNAFLFMASTNLYDDAGNPLNIYYGMDSGAFGEEIETDNSAIDIDTGVSISSAAPSTIQGVTAVTRNDNPIGLESAQDLTKLGIGVQLVMLKLGELFPIITPILNAIVFIAFAIQGFAVAYLGSIMIRGILGRIA